MHSSLLLSAAAGALIGAGTVFLCLQKRMKRCSNGNGDGDFIVETDTPHPSWQPGDLQPHPYLDLDSDSSPLSSEAGKACDTADDDGRSPTQSAKIRAALLASPRHYLDPSLTPSSALYNFTMSAFVPRPIALVSTQSPVGEASPEPSRNLAPFSYAGLVAHDPPHVAIGACFTSGKPDRMKDTLFNILHTKEFVVNLIGDWYIEAANFSCGFFDRGVDEMELAGLTPQESVKVAPPRVAEAAVQLECRLVATHAVFSRSPGVAGAAGAAGAAAAKSGAGDENGNGKESGDRKKQSTTVLIAEVVAIHVLESVSNPSPDGKSIVVDVRKLRPVCRLGMDTYGTLGRLFDLPRPAKEWQDKKGVK